MLVDTWTAALDSGTSRAVVRAGFADGVEFSNRVSGMYPGPAPGAATPLMLANAGFETPSLGLGHLYNPQNASWIFAGAAGVSYNNSGFTSGNPNAPQGAQVGFLQLTGTISQQVSGFQAGVGYTVKFKAAQRGNQTQAGQEVEVLLDDQSLGVFRPAGTSYSAHQTVSFVATAGAHTLRFVGRNPAGGDNTAFIDDVRVEGMAGGGGGGPVPRDGHAYLSFDPTTNRINSAGWLYDAAGNQTRVQTAGGGWLRHEYDAANRLVRVKADDNTTVIAAYTYGDTNQRLISDDYGLRTYYAADGGQVFAEYTEYGAQTVPQWAKSYVYLGGRLLSTFMPVTGGEAVEHHHPDRLGTKLVTRHISLRGSAKFRRV